MIAVRTTSAACSAQVQRIPRDSPSEARRPPTGISSPGTSGQHVWFDNVANGTIEGNLLGTDATGAAPLGEPSQHSIAISPAATRNLTIRGNVIAGGTIEGDHCRQRDRFDVADDHPGQLHRHGRHRHRQPGQSRGRDLRPGRPTSSWAGPAPERATSSPSTGAQESSSLRTARVPPRAARSGTTRSTTTTSTRRWARNAWASTSARTSDCNPTLNDLGDGDDGANHRQNFPMITSAAVAGRRRDARSRESSTARASTTYDLDFFSNPACVDRPQEFPRGPHVLGSAQVTTDGSGNANINVNLPVLDRARARESPPRRPIPTATPRSSRSVSCSPPIRLRAIPPGSPGSR